MSIQDITNSLRGAMPSYKFKAISPTAITVKDARGRQVGLISLGDPAATQTSINVEREGPYDLLSLQAAAEMRQHITALLSAKRSL